MNSENNIDSNEIHIAFLDHVAIRVKDLDVSADWYQRVLGLKKYQRPEWGDYPILLLAGKSGVALFPAKPDDPEIDPTSKNVKIDHFAFNVSHEDFARAQKRFTAIGLEFGIRDHHFFHSIYTRDPDGHTVELTTIVVDEGEFYG